MEDSEQDAALLTRHIARAGYELVSERVDTADAMRSALTSRIWDIILCDFSMPQFSAFAALDLLKETGLDVSKTTPNVIDGRMFKTTTISITNNEYGY